MLCLPGSSHPMTNSGSICSAGEESTNLLLYLQNHHPQASTSTNSVCLTRSMNSADINCPEQSGHIRSCTSPVLQQSAHHVKWVLPVAHHKTNKRSSDCCADMLSLPHSAGDSRNLQEISRSPARENQSPAISLKCK